MSNSSFIFPQGHEAAGHHGERGMGRDLVKINI